MQLPVMIMIGVLRSWIQLTHYHQPLQTLSHNFLFGKMLKCFVSVGDFVFCDICI